MFILTNYGYRVTIFTSGHPLNISLPPNDSSNAAWPAKGLRATRTLLFLHRSLFALSMRDEGKGDWNPHETLHCTLQNAHKNG